jgi:hypothetical protein
MYFLLIHQTGSSAGAINTCRSPRRVKLDGHKAMLASLGVSLPTDEVMHN